jgi:hypothetical protein
VERHPVERPFITNNFDLEVMFGNDLTEMKLVAPISGSGIADAQGVVIQLNPSQGKADIEAIDFETFANFEDVARHARVRPQRRDEPHISAGRTQQRSRSIAARISHGNRPIIRVLTARPAVDTLASQNVSFFA